MSRSKTKSMEKKLLKRSEAWVKWRILRLKNKYIDEEIFDKRKSVDVFSIGKIF